MTRRSIATVSLSGALDEKLRAIAAAGFEAVEIFENDLLSFGARPREIGGLCRDLGLDICAFQPFRDFEGMPEPQRARGFVRAERKFDLMQELGTDLLLICSNVQPASLGASIAPRRISTSSASARGRGVFASATRRWLGPACQRLPRRLEIVRRADHPSIGIILDSFHALAPLFPTGAIRSIPADKIFLVQLADAPKLELDILSWSRHFRSFRARAICRWPISCSRWPPPAIWVRSRSKSSTTSSAPAREPHRDRRHALADPAGGPARREVSRGICRKLTPKAQSRGVSFVEFAVNETRPANSPRCSVSSGSADGRHRSKAVERWSQGHVELIINCEPAGFAHSTTSPTAPASARSGSTSTMPAGSWRARSVAREGLPSAGRAGRAGNPRDPRRRRQPLVFSRHRGDKLGHRFRRAGKSRGRQSAAHGRSYLAVDAV